MLELYVENGLPKEKHLVKDADGESTSGGFSCSSVIVMQLHLSVYTRPDNSYAVNNAARYMICLKLLYEKHLKNLVVISK